MSLLNEVKELLESAKAKTARKIAAKKDARLTGKAKELKELGFDFAEGKGWDDYIGDISHWDTLINKKGYKSVINGLTTAANSAKDSENDNKDIKLADKIEKLVAKLQKKYKKDDKDPNNDILKKFDRQKK